MNAPTIAAASDASTRASFTARDRRATVRIMGDHKKPPPQPQPNDPPGNPDGQSDVSKPGGGDHRKRGK